MTTEREDKCDEYIATLDFSDLQELSVEKLIAMGWQARGKKDAERIAELEDRLEDVSTESIVQRITIAELNSELATANQDWHNLNSENNALNIQVQVLHEALEDAVVTSDKTPNTLGKSILCAYKFRLSNGEATVGELDFSGDTLAFTGNAEESAKVFMAYLATAFAGRLKAERNKARMQVAANLEGLFESYVSEAVMEMIEK